MLGIVALGPLLAEEKKPAGQVVVLTNDATLQGQVQRIGDAYYIRGERGTSVLKADQVAKVLDTLPETYAFLRSRANLRDPDERCRLARWCRSNGLAMEADAEVAGALELRPDHPEAIQLRTLLERDRAKAALKAQSTSTSAVSGAKPETPSRATFVALEGWDHVQSGPLFVEYTRSIQPTLFNGCGTGACHGNIDKAPGGFIVRRPYDAGNVTPYLTRQNLTQTLLLIDKKEPEKSKLLKKALEPHGGAIRGPLGDADSPAYRQLAAWVAKVAPSTVDNSEGVFASGKPIERAPVKTGAEPEGSSGFAAKHTPGPTAQEAVGPLQRGEPRKGTELKQPGTMGTEDPTQTELPRDAFGSPIPTRTYGKPPNKPSWLQTKLFGAPKEPPPQAGIAAEQPAWAAEKVPITNDPYDPAPFNRLFHGRKDSKP